MTEAVETVVIGAGQAGLAASYHLGRRGLGHVVLERGEIGETWRRERWDSFRLNTPNTFLQLPGHEYDGDDPSGFLTREETVAHLEHYAATIGGDIRTQTEVVSVGAADGGFAIESAAGPLFARNVVVAAGSFRRPPERPSPGGASDVLELHAGEYRRPDQLPDGGVLVVGSGQSGCQIAAELNRSGRDVYLSLGRCPSFPLWYRGRTAYDWLVDTGMMDETVDMLPSPEARLACNPTIASEDVAHLVGPHRLAREGVTLVGRVDALDGRRAVIRPDARERLAEAAGFLATFRKRVDDHVRTHGLALPEDEGAADGGVDVSDAQELDLERAGIRTILWANGFRPDYSWVEFPIFDSFGWPVQRRGATEVPGLYFVGLHWLHKRKSVLLLGVREDAEHVAETIAAA
jgi:putative flavoprotein involved in K+ transport